MFCSFHPQRGGRGTPEIKLQRHICPDPANSITLSDNGLHLQLGQCCDPSGDQMSLASSVYIPELGSLSPNAAQAKAQSQSGRARKGKGQLSTLSPDI